MAQEIGIIDLYKVLKLMIIAAQRGNKEDVLKLNSVFDNLLYRIFQGVGKLAGDYNNCRRFCNAAVLETNLQKRAQFVASALVVFSRLPVPRK